MTAGWSRTSEAKTARFSTANASVHRAVCATTMSFVSADPRSFSMPGCPMRISRIMFWLRRSPATPGDSLAGTLSGFTLLLPGEGEVTQDMPCPQPRAKDPPAYDKEELQTLLTAIASSSWDSVYAEAPSHCAAGRDSNWTRMSANASRQCGRHRRPICRFRPARLRMPRCLSRPSQNMDGSAGFQPSLHAAVAGVWVCLLILLNMSHKPVASGSAAGNMPTARSADPYRVDDSDSNAVVDGQLVKAADQEASDTPQTPKSIPFSPVGQSCRGHCLALFAVDLVG